MTEPGTVPPQESAAVQLWQRWRQGERVDVAEFLAGFACLGPTEMVAVLLIDQRERWQVGERIPTENYLRRYPGLAADAEAVVELAYGEFLVREENGEQPTLAEYQGRFPSHQERLGQQVDLHRVLQGQSASAEGTSSVLDANRTTAEPASPRESGIPEVPGYEILEVLGRGGMGVVYKARQVKANRLVALKMILAGSHAGAADRTRFHTEAEAIARLQHANIVQVYEVGENDGKPFFSLEFCGGGSLEKKLHGTPLPPREAAALVETLAQAMQAAHGQHIIHRDLKPANVLLTAEGVPKITDFGLAKKLDEAGQTQSGAIMGTPSYMAPEQAGGKTAEIGRLVDVYALGAILYECLTGRPPFKAATALDTIRQVINDEPVPPTHLQTRTPRDLETICLKCLQKEARKRYPTAGELADDLRRFLGGEPVVARPVGRLERGWRWCRRNPVVATMTTSLVLLLAVIAVGGGVLSLNLGVALEDARKKQADAEAAERGQREQTLEALLAEARAKRYSGRVGQCFETLAAIRKAVALARELEKPAAVFDDLRNLAVAALALPDFQEAAKTWDGWPAGSFGLDFDPVALRLYARGDQQGNVTVRRLEDDTEVARLPGLGRTRAIHFGADGRSLLLHDPGSGALDRWVIGGPPPERVATVTNDACLWQQSRDGGRLLVVHNPEGGPRSRLEVIDVPSRQLLLAYDWPTPDGYKTVWRAALSPDGRWLALADGAYSAPGANRVVLFDIDRGKQADTLLNPGTALMPGWHPDSRTLAVSDWNSGSIYVWDVPSKKLLRTLGDLKGGEPLLALSPSGQLLAGKSNWWGGQVFWHPHTGKPLLRTYAGYNPSATVQDGRLYEVAIDKTRVTLRTAEPSPVFRTLVPDPAGPPVSDCRYVTVNPDGRLLALGHTNGVSLFDLATGLELGRLPLGWNLFARFDPSNGDLLTYGPRGLFRWPVKITPGAAEVIRVGPPRLLAVGSNRNDAGFDVSQDGKVIAVACYTHALVYRQEGDRLRAVFLGPLTDTRAVRLSPDGRWALTVTHGIPDMRIWDTQSGQRVAKINEGDLFFTAGGRWLTNGRRRWEVGTWKEGPPVLVAEGPAAVEFSPDGALFAGESNGEVIPLVDTATGKTLVQFGLPEQSKFWCAAFSRDGTQFVHQSIDHQNVGAWDLRALRRHLAELRLDWAAPPFPPSRQERRLPPIVTIEPIDSSLRPEMVVERLDPSAWIKRGRRHAKGGRWDEAAAAFVRALALLPPNYSHVSERSRLCDELAGREGAFAKAIELRPDDAGLWLARGRYFARQGQWEKGAAAYGKAKASPSAEDFDNHFFVEQAAIQLLARDAAGYKATCTTMQERLGRKEGPEIAYLIGRTCMLGPASGTSPLDTVRSVERALPTFADKNYKAACMHVLAMAYYRAGKDGEAVRQSLAAIPNWMGTYVNLPVLALAHHRLGHKEQARQWLEKADSRSEQLARGIDKQGVGFPDNVNPADWLEFQALRREAGEALRGQPLKLEK